MTTDIVPPLKRCTKCGNEYPATTDYFSRRSLSKDGLFYTCKACNGSPFGTKEGRASTPYKQCRKCGVEFPRTAEYFHKRSATPDGLYADCKPCNNEYLRSQYHKDPERHLEYNREWVKANRLAVRKIYARWRRNNPERTREICSTSEARRRARMKNLGATFTAKHRRFGLEYFHGCCAVCGRPLKDLFGTHTVHWDHWIPLSKGGASTPDNMVPLCGGENGCNNKKGSMNPRVWLENMYGKKKSQAVLARVNAYFEYVKEA